MTHLSRWFWREQHSQRNDKNINSLDDHVGMQRVPLGLKCIVLNTYLHKCQGFYSQKADTWKGLYTCLVHLSFWASGLPESQWAICIHKINYMLASFVLGPSNGFCCVDPALMYNATEFTGSHAGTLPEQRQLTYRRHITLKKVGKKEAITFKFSPQLSLYINTQICVINFLCI